MKTAGILLASGQSQRLGEPKQLLDWHGYYLINFVIEQIYQSEIDKLLVVLGCQHEKIQQILDNRVKVILNDDWREGKSTSIEAGLKAIDHDVTSVIFFAGDQPYITSELINRIINVGKKSRKLIVAARVNKIMTIPVLYKKEVFRDLVCLKGEQGGKKIMKKYIDDLEVINWKDERLLIDIDTEADYKNALSLWKN